MDRTFVERLIVVNTSFNIIDFSVIELNVSKFDFLNFFNESGSDSDLNQPLSITAIMQLLVPLIHFDLGKRERERERDWK
jgi:hypothetical protein